MSTKKIFTICVFFLSLSLNAQTTFLDTTFNGTGIVYQKINNTHSYGYYILSQDDGKYIVVGRCGNGTAYDITISRFLQNGQIDNSYANNGTQVINVNFDHEPIGSFLTSDNKLVVTGRFCTGSLYDVFIFRLNTNGILDTTFGNNGISTFNVEGSGYSYEWALCSEKMNDDNFVISGTIYDPQTIQQIFLIKYLSNGLIDTSFGNNGEIITNYTGSKSPKSILINKNNEIILVANSSLGSLTFIKYNSTGEIDTNFGDNGISFQNIGSTHKAIISADDKIYVVFKSSNNTNQKVVKFNSDGQIDETFGLNGYAIVDSIENKLSFENIKIDSIGNIILFGLKKGERKTIHTLVKNNGIIDFSFGENGIIETTMGDYDLNCRDFIFGNNEIISTGHTRFLPYSNLNKLFLTKHLFQTSQSAPIIENNSFINIYPIPTSDYIVLDVDKVLLGKKIFATIYSVDGIKLMNTQIVSEKQVLDLTKIHEKGTLIITISNEFELFTTKKIIVN